MKYGDMVARHPYSIILTIVVVTIILGASIESIETTSEMTAYLPDNEEAEKYKEIKEEYGAVMYSLIFVEATDGDVLSRDEFIDTLKVEWQIENSSLIREGFALGTSESGQGSVMSLVDGLAYVIAGLTDVETVTRADMYENLTEPNSVWVKTFNEWFTVLKNSGYFEEWVNATYFDERCIKAAIHLIFNVAPKIAEDLNIDLGIEQDVLSNLIKMLSNDFVYKEEDIDTYLDIRAKAQVVTIQLDNSMSVDSLIKITEKIESIVQSYSSPHVKLTVFAGRLITRDINESANRSLATLLPLALVVIIIILLISLRNIVDTFLSLAALGMSLLWMYGVANILDLTLTTITIAAPILLIGLGIDYALYIILHYRNEVKSGYGVEDAMKRTVGNVGVAILLSVLTTVAGFLSNLFSDLTAIAEFGILCASGIASSFLIANTFLPASRYVIDRAKEKKGKSVLPKHERKELEREARDPGYKEKKNIVLDSVAKGAIKSPQIITVVAVVFTLMAAYLTTQLDYSFNDREFLPEDAPILDTIEYMEENYQVSTSYVSIWAEGDITDPNMLYAINGTTMNMRDDSYILKSGGVPQVDNALTYIQGYASTSQSDAFRKLYEVSDLSSDNIPDANLNLIYQWIYEDEYARTVMKQYVHYSNPITGVFTDFIRYYVGLGRANESFVQDYNEVKPISEDRYDENVTSLLTSVFSDPEMLGEMKSYVTDRQERAGGAFDGTVIRVFVMKMDSKQIDELIDQLRNDVSMAPDTDENIYPLERVSNRVIITDGPILTHIIINSVQENQRNSIIIMVIIALIMLSLVYRFGAKSATLGMVTALPIIFVVAWILASLYLVGLTINVMTTMIAALTIGLGIDYSIHISHQFIEHLTVLRDREEAVELTVNHTGKALLGAGLTTIGGFVVLTLSPLPPLRQFGGITALTIVYGMIAALFVLPSMLLLWSKGKEDLYEEDIHGQKYMEYTCGKCGRKFVLKGKEKDENVICPYCKGKSKYSGVVNIKNIEQMITPKLYISRYRCPACGKTFDLKSTAVKNETPCVECGAKAKLMIGRDGMPKTRAVAMPTPRGPSLSYMGYPGYYNQYYYRQSMPYMQAYYQQPYGQQQMYYDQQQRYRPR